MHSLDRPAVPIVAVLGFGLAVAGVASFINGVDAPFIFDDEPAIVENATIRSLADVTLILQPPRNTTVAGRPILNLSFALNYSLSGLAVRGYHIANIVIHIVAGLLLFGVLRRTLRLPCMSDRVRESAEMLAFASALLWLVHPIQAQSVTYIVQRAESLAGLLYLGAMYGLIRGAAPGGRSWYVASVVCAALGVATKEHVATLPIVVLLYDRCFLAGSFRASWAARRGLYVGLVSTWLILAGLILSGPRDRSVGFAEGMLTPLQYALTQPGVIVHYLGVACFPRKLVLDYAWPPVESIGDVLLPASVLFVLLVLTVAGLWHRSRAGFLGCWLFIILAPTSSFVPIADPAFVHRMYLPLAAVTTLVVVAAFTLLDRTDRTPHGRTWARSIGAVAILAAATALTAATVRRNGEFRSAVAIWTSTVERAPWNHRAHFNLATAHRKRGDKVSARRHTLQAIELRPNYAVAHGQLAMFDFDEGRLDSALSHARRSVELDGEDAQLVFNLGTILSAAGEDIGAGRAYLRAIELQPDHAAALYNLGNIAARAGRLEEAEAWWRRAIERGGDAIGMDATAIDARINLAGLLHRTGRPDDARLMIDDALQFARLQAEADRRAGRASDAVEFESRIVRVRPDDTAARLRLARDLIELGRLDEALVECSTVLRASPGDAQAAAMMAELRELMAGRP